MAHEDFARFRNDKLPFDVSLIPLLFNTFGLWEENAATDLIEIVNIQAINMLCNLKNK